PARGIAGDELHDQVEEAGLLIDVGDADQVRRLDARGDARLAQEPLDDAVVLGGELQRQDLHRYLALQQWLEAQVDPAHPTPAELDQKRDAAERRYVPLAEADARRAGEQTVAAQILGGQRGDRALMAGAAAAADPDAAPALFSLCH